MPKVGLDLENMTIAALEAEHQERDRQVIAVRAEMGEIHAEICRKESLVRVANAGPAHLLQTASMDQILGMSPDRAREVFKALKEKLGL